MYYSITWQKSTKILYFNYDNGNQVGFKLVRKNGKFYFNEDFKVDAGNTINYKLPIFYELGNYQITYKYQAFIDGEFVWEENDDGNIKIGKDNLIVFGYNLSYAKDLSGEDYFTSLKGYQTDFSYKYVTNNDGVESVSDFILPSLDSFTSTNQAPVWLNSNVYLRVGNTSNSYYYYSYY